MTTKTEQTSAIIPTLRYRDAPAAIEWLCKALGFERHLVVPGGSDGEVGHAELRFGCHTIMLGSARPGELGGLLRLPSEFDGANTLTVYVVVPKIDEHYARAKAAGAEVVAEIRDEDHGRGYSCRDPEGYIWHFGSYDPSKADA